MLAGADPYTDAYLDVYGIPFPLANLDLKYEILVNGTWTDITGFVFWGTDTVIGVPMQDETSQATFTQATFMVNNADGRFSQENPAGAYYPWIARNIQLRISVGMDYVGASSYSGYRFWGEATSWIPGQDSSGNYQYAAVMACGVLRRFNQGAKIGSALRRYYSKLIGDPRFPYGAWPGEDSGSATEIGSMVTGVPGMTFTGTPQFASSTAFGGSDPIPITAGSAWHGLTLAAESPPSAGSLTENSPGTYTWTCPPGVTSVSVANVGAGGGGGFAATTYAAGGGGGGAGESAANSSVAVTADATYTYVVPAGGAPGTTVAPGSAGVNATFTGDSVTVTAHGGHGGTNGGSSGGSGGAGGSGSVAPTHHNGGAGGAGSTNAMSVHTQTVTGKAGGSGGGTGIITGVTTASWTAPFGTATVDVTSCTGAGGGGGGGGGVEGGGNGGGGGAFSAGTVNVTPGTAYAPYAGNGGSGGDGGGPSVLGAPGNTGGPSAFTGDSGSNASAGGGGGGATGGGGGGGEGGSVGGGTGNPGGQSGNGAASSSAHGGGGGGGGGAGNASATGDTGANGSGRAPGAATLSGGGAKGGSGKILPPGGGQAAGSTGYANGGGGGGGGAASDSPSFYDGTNGGGGAPGSVTWTWTNDAPTGGGGGSSGGTSAAGNSGLNTGAGGAAVTGGGAGGNMDTGGATPGGGGGGQDPAGSAPGAGAPGQVSFSWNGGSVSPVPANYLRFLLDVPLAGETDGAVIARAVCFGDVARLDVVYHTAAGGSLEFIGYDSSSSTIFDSGSQAFTADGTPLLVSASVQSPDGTTVNWALQATDQLGNVTSFTGTVSGYAIGNASDVYVNPNGTLTAAAVGWVTAQNYCDPIADMGLLISGYNGELMADRLSRLCGEEGFGFTLIGADTDTPQLGPQQDDTFVNVLQSCMDADRGILFEPADAFGLTYRTRLNMCGQSPAVILDWSAGQLAAPAPAPVTDDQQTRNDITLTRNGGSSVTAVLNDGSAMSVSDPPNGVGDYTYSLTVFLYQDSQLANMSQWMLTVGTVPGARYPALAEDLSRADVQSLTSVIPALGHGDWVQVVSPPSQLTPGPIDQLLWGWTETLNSKKWTFAYNLVPEAPYSSGPQVLNVNPDFATGDTTGWNGFNGTIAYDGSPPGTPPQPQACVLTPNGSSDVCALEGDPTDQFTVVPSAQYLAEAWVYTAGASLTELGFDWHDASSGYLSTTSAGTAVSAGQWTHLSAILTSPDASTGVTYGIIRVGRNGRGSAVSSGDTLEATAIQCIYPTSVW